jgi:adenylosuccinate synthase
MGDEGKGKIVDVLTSNTISLLVFKVDQMQDLEFDGIKHVLRTIPSGIFIKQCKR